MFKKKLPSPSSGSESDSAAGSVIHVPANDTKTKSPPTFKPTRDFLLAFSSLLIVILAISVDATSLSVALPIISAELGGTALEAFWSGTSFLLASTVLQPTVASLSNIFGRKYLIYVTGALFFAGSLVAALADNFTVILVGRTIQGVGGGGLIALTEVVITDLIPLAFRGQWFSLLSAMWSIGTVTGPMIGAGFAQNVSWRWIFYINLPAIGLGLIAVFFFLHQAPVPGGIMYKLGRFDWTGSFLFTASSTGFLFGITAGGVMYEWSSWRVLLPMIVGFFGIVVFGWYEFKIAKEPIINKGVFNNWAMSANYIVSIFHGIILWSLLYFLVLYYQGVKFYTPIISSVAVLPETLTVAPAGAAVGFIAGTTMRYRWALWSGWVITVLGSGILLLLGPNTTVIQFIFLNIPIGIGTGMLFPAMALSIQAACEPALNGQAAAFFSFVRTFGQAVGVAISGVVFQNSFKNKLQDIPQFANVAGEYAVDATAVVEIIKAMPESTEKTLLAKAYSDSLRMIWVTLLAFAAFSMIISLTVKSYSLQQEHVTEQGIMNADERRGAKRSASDEETGPAEK